MDSRQSAASSSALGMMPELAAVAARQDLAPEIISSLQQNLLAVS
jgi:hypothetical protein